MADSYHSIIEPIILTASRLEVIANRYLFGPIGMNIPNVKIMGLLCRKKIMTPKEIMELAGGTKSNISQRLDSLEKKGFVEMHRNTKTDKRMVLVKLSALGKKKLLEMHKQIREVKLELESNFTQEEISQHYAFFNKLNKLVDSSKKDFPRCKCKNFCK